MNTLASLLLLFATINFVLSDGITRDIQQTQAKIAAELTAELAAIQEEEAEETILRSINGSRPGDDALTRDLARIQADAAQERIAQQPIRGGGGFNGGAGGFNNGAGGNYGRAGGYNGGGGSNQQWGRRVIYIS